MTTRGRFVAVGAALFATTVVYGRLSADNELTACRAGGLSHLTVTLPAFILGHC